MRLTERVANGLQEVKLQENSEPERTTLGGLKRQGNLIFSSMLVLDWKERTFKEKVSSGCFCWFLAAILVHQNGAPICCPHTKLYKGAWNVSANYSETMGHKDLRLGQIAYILSFITLHFLSLFHRRVSNLILCCVTVKTIYSQYTHLVAQVSSTQHYRSLSQGHPTRTLLIRWKHFLGYTEYF